MSKTERARSRSDGRRKRKVLSFVLARTTERRAASGWCAWPVPSLGGTRWCILLTTTAITTIESMKDDVKKVQGELTSTSACRSCAVPLLLSTTAPPTVALRHVRRLNTLLIGRIGLCSLSITLISSSPFS